jgi:hypothetical protein
LDIEKDIMLTLVGQGYINDGNTSPQTNNLVWEYQNEQVKVNISACDTSIKAGVYSSLSDNEKAIVVGGVTT